MAHTITTKALTGALKSGITGTWKCDRTKGLSIKIGARGAVFSWQRRVLGVPRTIKLGTFGPKFGIADARAKAAELNEDLACGVDVYVKHGVGQDTSRQRVLLTCDEAFQRRLSMSDNEAHTLRTKRSIWKCHFRDRIGDKLVQDVTYDDLADIIDDVRADGKMTTANRAIAHLREFFKWCESNPRITGLEESPARKLQLTTEKPRKRYLSMQEIKWLWESLDEVRPVWADCIRVIILTGLRKSEIVELERDELELDKTWIDIPAARMKKKTRHIAPVGPRAWSIITVRAASHTSKYVHQSPSTTDRDVPISSDSKVIKALNLAMQKRANAVGATVKHWSLHTLRHTFATQAASILDADEMPVIAPHVIERCLAHQIAGTAGVYNHAQYIAEKRRAWTVWENKVREAVGENLFEKY